MSNLKLNPNIKNLRRGDRVYSHEDYAQDLYDLISNVKDTSYAKTIQEGDIIQIDRVNAQVGNNIYVSGYGANGISIKVSKEREFFSIHGLTVEGFIDAVNSGQIFNALITDIDPIMRGTFIGAHSDVIKEEFFSQLKGADKVYEAKILEKNKGGYFVNVQGVTAFMPGSLSAPNKIIDFDSLIGKTVKVMIDSYIPESETFIVSHKKYISMILPTQIENLDYRTPYIGEVTGSIDKGIFIEFNEIMTGLLSPDEMNPEIKAKFYSRSIKPGDNINIWIKDIQFKKNFILTQTDPSQSIENLQTLRHIWLSKDKDTAYQATVLSIRNSILKLSLGEDIQTSINLRETGYLRGIHFKEGQQLPVTILDIVPERNILSVKIQIDNK